MLLNALLTRKGPIPQISEQKQPCITHVLKINSIILSHQSRLKYRGAKYVLRISLKSS